MNKTEYKTKKSQQGEGKRRRMGMRVLMQKFTSPIFLPLATEEPSLTEKRQNNEILDFKKQLTKSITHAVCSHGKRAGFLNSLNILGEGDDALCLF